MVIGNFSRSALRPGRGRKCRLRFFPSLLVDRNRAIWYHGGRNQLSRILQVSTDLLLQEELTLSDTAAFPPAVASPEPSAPRVPPVPAPSANGAARAPAPWAILGTLLTTLGAVGLLILGILSSVYPAFITFPIEVGKEGLEVVQTGLPAFLELHNLEWLFYLCCAAALAGVGLLLFRAIRKKVKREGPSHP